MYPEGLDLNAYSYDLPDEKIARYPLKERSQAKLLCYTTGKITHFGFHQIPDLLPENAHLVFNDTKVIPARIIFYKETGARIEVFLLEPIAPSNVYDSAMSSKAFCSWKVLVGNSRKWKIDTSAFIHIDGLQLEARRIDENIVSFHWDTAKTFSEVLTKTGTIPLPPYMGRAADADDIPRYQTVYSKHEGAVAAPTAGLHFTPDVLSKLSRKGISSDFLTLHVSAGTFQPIKTAQITEHPMHREQLVISKKNVERLLKARNTVAVGTTSLRTIESLYWFGCKLATNPDAPFFIEKLSPYQADLAVSKEESLQHVLTHMNRNDTETLIGHTEIFIFPGYTFRVCQGLITNFHLPGSTLILLVAAMVGDDWKTIYKEALARDYRFLSYGDCSLILP